MDQTDPVSPQVVQLLRTTPREVPSAQLNQLRQESSNGEAKVVLNNVRVETGLTKRAWSQTFDVVLPIQRR
ncbi:hypothetical protein OP10G_0025 [Fimbriimonas ginsengisoli Gsoil 348]|uniref:Uncharacterized protein n=1 Tax=Fimbriimonas ginsengisoli Gsoil 348 TaxID=661478 RepID=A0A068NIF3_FIMGI|nr:hypothetical protein OP10G_0025 [Fimbriimonas ginsengisoli Gsoil 348]